MTDARKAMQQALQTLEQLDGIDTETECVTIDVGDTIEALRSALSQQGEPVAWIKFLSGAEAKPNGQCYDIVFAPRDGYQPLYAAAPAAQPVQGEPVMVYHGRCTIDCGDHGHHDVELLKLIPAGTKLYAGAAPAAQPETVPLAEYQKLQALVTSQGIRLMEYEAAPAAQPQNLTIVSSYTADIDAIRRKEKEAGEAFMKQHGIGADK